ncbi:methyltransferase [Helicobacter sp. T3_23-1056]
MQMARIDKIKDYADCADASYALLECATKDYVIDETKSDFSDGQKLDDTFNGQNSTYTRAIEARFNNDKVGDWCMPLIDTCLSTKDKIANKDISAITLDFKLSKRTIDFVNRFKILAHQPNIERSRENGKNSDSNCGFSATLFEDTLQKKFIWF